MGKYSKITWTTHTWNPWYGCERVSIGCANCYALNDLTRYGLLERMSPDRDGQASDRAGHVLRSRTTFRAPLSWSKQQTNTPGSERVFTCSWSDFFLPQADAWRPDAWDIIRATPELTYLILTKRPELVESRLPQDWGPNGWPHVWLGVSIENQKAADHRLPLLMRLPATHRFVSCEPMLGRVSLITAASTYDVMDTIALVNAPRLSVIHWVIAGGESGRAARPCDPEWVRGLRSELSPQQIPFYFKQWGEWLPRDQQTMQGAPPVSDPDFAYVRMGKFKAGYLLDGEVVQQFPEMWRSL